MKSMTGYGKGEAALGGRTLTIELKTVNNRYLDINARVPKSLSFCDDIIRQVVQKSIKRGTVDVLFNYENHSEDSKEVIIDMQLAGEYFKAAKKLRTEFMLEGDFHTAALMRYPDVLKVEYCKDDPKLIGQLVLEATKAAAADLEKMREAEGASIKADLTKLIENLVRSLKEVTKRAPNVVAEYRVKIETRMKEILKTVEVDEARLMNEVVFFSDKADINEEISRLTSHIDQFVKSMESDEPQGRKLDFISQEMNREINTIGSKSNDIELASHVIAMKNELEKLKEQIRNVE